MVGKGDWLSSDVCEAHQPLCSSASLLGALLLTLGILWLGVFHLVIPGGFARVPQVKPLSMLCS